MERFERFAGHESRVYWHDATKEQRIKVHPPHKAARAIAELLADGAKLDRQAVVNAYVNNGLSPKSAPNLRFDITSGRFTKKTAVPVRIVKVGDEEFLYDARRLESDFIQS